MKTSTPSALLLRQLSNHWLIILLTLLFSVANLYAASPVADAGADQTVLDREDDDYQDVILDGTASTDSDDDIVSYLWQEGATTLSTDALCRVNLAVGTHTLTLTVTDAASNTDTDTVSVTVEALTGNLQRLNLAGTSTPRFTRPMDLVWPSNVGDMDICLWEDDKFAAVSITIDDNIAPDHDWWIARGNEYGWKFTWFIIINSLYENSGNSYFGSWPEFNTLYGYGHDVQSHTISHHSDDDVRDEDEVIIEYRDSLAEIEENMSGNIANSFAWPYGKSNSDIAKIYATCARGTTGTPNKPESVNYINTGSSSGRIDAAYIDPILYGTSSISWMNNTNYLRGWLSSHFHSVNDKTSVEAAMDYIDARSDLLWVGKFRDVAFYGQERDTTTIGNVSVTSSQISFSLSDEMDDTIFTYPLTIKIRIDNTWTDISATQDGSSIDANVVTHTDGNKYALIKAVPDQGTVIVTPAGQSNIAPIADAGSDQSITDTDDSGAESVTLDGTASTDSDGTIISYVWTEGGSQIATGSNPAVSLDVGTHTITLTVTDDDSATDTDTVEITVAAPASGRTIYINGDGNDRGMYADGSMTWVGQTEARVGGATTQEGAAVLVFELPTLNAGETITSASLDVYLNGISNSPNGNVDVYGIGYRTSSAVESTDFYQGPYDGDTTDAWAVQSGIADANSTAGWLYTSTAAEANLASYLNDQYTAGATGGDFVFIRINAVNDQSSYYYWKIATANSANIPILTIQTGNPNTAPTANAGSDQNITDTDDSGAESVTLDGTASADSDGTITSYVWAESGTQIATGSSPSVSLTVGTHTITLTVTDDDGATDTDTVTITVAEAPQTRTIYIYGDGNDRGMYADGSMTWVGQTEARVGGATTQEGAAVLVFELPTLNTGETIVSASLDVYLNGIANSPNGNVDVYGIGYRTSSAVESTDFYQGPYDGDTTDAWAVQSGIADANSTAGWLYTSTAAEANLASYLNDQYTAGATGGDFVFIRINAVNDQSSYYYWKIATANSANVPLLTIEAQ